MPIYGSIYIYILYILYISYMPIYILYTFCFLKQLQRFNVQVRYGMAKLATLLLAQEVDRRVGSFGVYSNAVHPGVVASDPLVCK